MSSNLLIKFMVNEFPVLVRVSDDSQETFICDEQLPRLVVIKNT